MVLAVVSVEEARAALWERLHEWRYAVAVAASLPIAQHTLQVGERITATAQAADAALDRYRDVILANQPCYREWARAAGRDGRPYKTCGEMGELANLVPKAICSTCEARRRLE